MEQVENRMVVGWQWPEEPEEVKEKWNDSGWRHIVTGVFVPDEDAFDYAMEHCIKGDVPEIRCFTWEPEFKEMVVEWFYSGNWIKED